MYTLIIIGFIEGLFAKQIARGFCKQTEKHKKMGIQPKFMQSKLTLEEQVIQHTKIFRILGFGTSILVGSLTFYMEH